MRPMILAAAFIATLLSSSPAHSEDYVPGTVRSFWQLDVVKMGDGPDKAFYQADFTCVRRGDRSYIFVQNGLPETVRPTDAYIDRIFQRFETMFPTITALYGDPTDVDHNGRFIILLGQIRDWYYYGQDASANGQPPIQGYLWPDFVNMNGNDYLTMATNSPGVDALGTMIHEFTHNIYDASNPAPQKPEDRGVTEAIANYAIRVNGTLDQDSYFAFQKNILTADLSKGLLLNPFDGTHNYFDPTAPGFHHCYAAGYYFIEFLMDSHLARPVPSAEFFRSLIQDLPNAGSLAKMEHSMRRFGMLPPDQDFNTFYNTEFRKYLTAKLITPTSQP